MAGLNLFLKERFVEMNISSALILGVAIVTASYVLKPDRNPPYRYHTIQGDGNLEHILRETKATGDLCTMPLGLLVDRVVLDRFDSPVAFVEEGKLRPYVSMEQIIAEEKMKDGRVAVKLSSNFYQLQKVYPLPEICRP